MNYLTRLLLFDAKAIHIDSSNLISDDVSLIFSLEDRLSSFPVCGNLISDLGRGILAGIWYSRLPNFCVVYSLVLYSSPASF